MGRLEPCIIGFSGRISSGKTTVSQAVADAVQWPRASFGDFVRSVANSRGLDFDSRPVLQEVGESLIAKGWPTFCQNVLGTIAWKPGAPAVVDGIRHIEAVDHLKELVKPLRFVLVHVAIEEEVRHARMRQRDGDCVKIDVESHSTEAAVKNVLPRLANVTVDAAQSLDNIVSEILSYLKCT